MNHKRVALVLFSAVSFFSTISVASADVDSTGFEGTRQWLREHCAKIHGEIVEGHKRTTCITVAGVEIVCRHNNHCSRNRYVFEKTDEPGGSLSGDNDDTVQFHKAPEGTDDVFL